MALLVFPKIGKDCITVLFVRTFLNQRIPHFIYAQSNELYIEGYFLLMECARLDRRAIAHRTKRGRIVNAG
jgi:hypothetical protein